MNDKTHAEVDMGYVQGFVNLIAQALVAATELPKQIEAMQADLTTLHGDLDRTKQRNIELDTLTSDLRRQRDEAEQALSQVKADLTRAMTEKSGFEFDLNRVNGQVVELKDKLAKAQQERDDYGLKHMAAEDRANEAEGKLKKLREALGMTEPEAKPEPVKSVEPLPPQDGWKPYSDPPTEQVALKRIYEGDPGFNDLSYTTENFDSVRGSWFRTA